MARDPGLEALIRESLRDHLPLCEKPMFGGLAWLVDGNLLVCASHSGMLVRLGTAQVEAALEHSGIGPAVMGARTMSGWVVAGPDAYGDDAIRAKLIDAALTFVATLPPK